MNILFTNIKMNQTNLKRLPIIFLIVGCLLLGLSESINIIITILIIAMFLILDVKTCLIMNIYLLVWEKVFLTNGILQYSQYIAVILLIRVIIFSSRNIKISHLDIIFLLFLSIYSAISYLEYKDSTGLWFLVDIMVIVMVYIPEIKKDPTIIRIILLILATSVFFGMLWGVFHPSKIHEYIGMLGNVKRFSGVYEPNFMAMYINMALIIIYFLVKNLIVKLLAISVLYIALIATFSMAGFLCNIVFWLMISSISIARYLKTLKKGRYHKLLEKRITIRQILVGLIIIVMLFILPNVVKIPAVSQSLNDINVTVKVLLNMNGNASIDVTNGRNVITAAYLQLFEKSSIFEQIFGFGIFNVRGYANKFIMIQYTHNSYIDMLYIFGILGIIFLVFRILAAIIRVWKSELPNKDCIIILKVIVLIEMFSLTMLTSKAAVFFMFI